MNEHQQAACGLAEAPRQHHPTNPRRAKKRMPEYGTARVGELLYVGGAGLEPTDGSVVWKQEIEYSVNDSYSLDTVAGDRCTSATVTWGWPGRSGRDQTVNTDDAPVGRHRPTKNDREELYCRSSSRESTAALSGAWSNLAEQAKYSTIHDRQCTSGSPSGSDSRRERTGR